MENEDNEAKTLPVPQKTMNKGGTLSNQSSPIHLDQTTPTFDNDSQQMFHKRAQSKSSQVRKTIPKMKIEEIDEDYSSQSQ